jgi:hypothetical protein
MVSISTGGVSFHTKPGNWKRGAGISAMPDLSVMAGGGKWRCPGIPHFAQGKTGNLFISNGAPAQQELFDYKPKLRK